jgi:hypothetical protein
MYILTEAFESFKSGSKDNVLQEDNIKIDPKAIVYEGVDGFI